MHAILMTFDILCKVLKPNSGPKQQFCNRLISKKQFKLIFYGNYRIPYRFYQFIVQLRANSIRWQQLYKNSIRSVFK